MNIITDSKQKISWFVRVLPSHDKQQLQTMYWRTKHLIDLVLDADRQDTEAKQLRASTTQQQLTEFQQFITTCEDQGIQYLERQLN